jgi:hypothetical protein
MASIKIEIKTNTNRISKYIAASNDVIDSASGLFLNVHGCPLIPD